MVRFLSCCSVWNGAWASVIWHLKIHFITRITIVNYHRWSSCWFMLSLGITCGPSQWQPTCMMMMMINIVNHDSYHDFWPNLINIVNYHHDYWPIWLISLIIIVIFNLYDPVVADSVWRSATVWCPVCGRRWNWNWIIFIIMFFVTSMIMMIIMINHDYNFIMKIMGMCIRAVMSCPNFVL